MKRGTRRLFFDMARFGIPNSQYTKQMLMVGSCTKPAREGQHWTGDLSGILGLNRPLWMERYYRPGRHITDLPEWSDRIERMAEEAPHWDIGFAVSNPMWLQLILERIIEKHGLQHIHQIWPDFSVFVHGGVFFEPYQSTFEVNKEGDVIYMNFGYSAGLARTAKLVGSKLVVSSKKVAGKIAIESDVCDALFEALEECSNVEKKSSCSEGTWNLSNATRSYYKVASQKPGFKSKEYDNLCSQACSTGRWMGK